MSWIIDVESPVAASRLFKALLDWHNLAPKITPEIVTSGRIITLNETEGVGSVRQINFSSAMPFEFIKERLDFVDLDNFVSKHSLVEGGELGKKVESATSEYKFTPSNSGGCNCKVVMTFKLLPGVQSADEEAKGRETVTGVIKSAEAYLLANPTAYV